MERIKRFFKDESGSSEAASSVILIAGVGGMLLAAILLYYGAMNGFFQHVKAKIDTYSTTTWM